jgi:alpha-galactosidase
MIPAMVDIAKDVLELAPKALFFNYGNPMAPVCRGVRKATGANMIGLCHGVFHVGQYLAEALGVEAGELEYTAMGMNHLTWFTEMRVKGQDVIDRLEKFADEQIAKVSRSESSPAEVNLFTWSLFKLIKAFPAVRDRHVTEFFPHLFSRLKSYYGVTLGVEAYSFENTIARGDQIFDQMRQDALSEKPLEDEYFKAVGGEHEQVMEIIESIRQDKNRIFSANLPNHGQIPNLPIDSIVECPVVVNSSGLHAIMQKPLPVAAAGVLATRLMWVETVVEAALEGSRDKFVQALLLDGAVTSFEMAEKLADELLEVQSAYLPQFSKKNRVNILL